VSWRARTGSIDLCHRCRSPSTRSSRSYERSRPIPRSRRRRDCASSPRLARWIALHASRLASTGTERRTIVIIEPATPVEIEPLIVHAYGLSPREREICRLVLQGLCTAAISEQLHISANTVQDHLEGIFEKTDINSRRELAGRLFGEHYRPRSRGVA
jgi:DNA-binding CsgD family transcriptional regulator